MSDEKSECTSAGLSMVHECEILIHEPNPFGLVAVATIFCWEV